MLQESQQLVVVVGEEVGEVRISRRNVPKVTKELALLIVDGPDASTFKSEHLHETAGSPPKLPLLQGLHRRWLGRMGLNKQGSPGLAPGPCTPTVLGQRILSLRGEQLPSRLGVAHVEKSRELARNASPQLLPVEGRLAIKQAPRLPPPATPGALERDVVGDEVVVGRSQPLEPGGRANAHRRDAEVDGLARVHAGLQTMGAEVVEEGVRIKGIDGALPRGCCLGSRFQSAMMM